MIESGCCEAEEHRERAIAVATDAGGLESAAELFACPGLPRIPIPDYASENAAAVIGAKSGRSRRSVQHGIQQVKSDTSRRRRTDF